MMISVKKNRISTAILKSIIAKKKTKLPDPIDASAVHSGKRERSGIDGRSPSPKKRHHSANPFLELFEVTVACRGFCSIDRMRRI
jgi:hypothetical protein